MTSYHHGHKIKGDNRLQQEHLGQAELHTLIQISKIVNSSLELNTAIHNIVRSAQMVLGGEAASLFLLDETRQKLSFYVAKGVCAEKLKDIELNAKEGVVGWVVEHKESVIVNDVNRDRRFCKRIDKMSQFKTRSIMCVPLLIKSKLLGALELLNKREGSFTLRDLRICEGIASQAAIALENAKLYEENLKKERLAAIGQTIAGTAHCIKNILNLVKGGAFIVQQGFKQNNLEKIRSGWDMFEKNHGKIEELILDMLTYSKERKPALAEHDIVSVIDELCESLSRSEEENLQILKHLDTSVGTILFDRTALQRCLLNLLGNAVDACDKAIKKITITTRSRAEAGWYEISIADNGCGIAEEKLLHVFEPFYSTKGSKGTGLGLPVTHKIIKEHGGRIDISSTPGEGTEFTIVLPKDPSLMEKKLEG